MVGKLHMTQFSGFTRDAIMSDKTKCLLCGGASPVLLEGELWTVILNRNQNLLGKTLIATKRHTEDVAALRENEWEELHALIRRVKARLIRAFRPDHWNYAFLMNLDLHVHLHVWPRYASPREYEGIRFEDPDFPGPVDPTRELRLPEQVHAELGRMLAGVLAPKPVVIVEYEPNWPSIFEDLRKQLLPALEGIAVAIEHVGSTAVPGLVAKPIIDIDVVVASTADIPEAIERLKTLGYEHRGDLGIPGREAFSLPPGLPTHYLYVVVLDSKAYWDHVLLRDWLRSHSDDARRYAELKRANASRFQSDRDGYTWAKADFVEGILERAREDRDP